METNSILTASILDILFEGKNKEYGAYDLRKSYDSRIGIALGITIIVILIAVLAMLWKQTATIGKTERPDIVTELPPSDPVKQIIPQVKLPTPEPVKTVKNTPPIIVNNNEVPEPPAAVEEFDKAAIGIQNSNGKEELTINPPIEINRSSVAVEGPKKINIENEPPFSKVEIEAKFSGNWNSYVKKEIEKNIDELTEAGESGTCIVRFVVSKDGSVSNVEALTMKGTKLAEIAVNAIRKGPKWIPAIQNGREVNAYRQQPITFVITN
jgi:protein TonB